MSTQEMSTVAAAPIETAGEADNHNSQKSDIPWYRRIHFRFTLFAWAIVVVTLLLYTATDIPHERSIAIKRMSTEARDIANSVSQVTATALVSENYGAVVDHCMRVVKESRSILYLVVTRRDGFSLIHTSGGWRKDILSGVWTNRDSVAAEYFFHHTTLAGRAVFHFSYPFNYSGIDWGWIHVGLNLRPFEEDMKTTMYRAFSMLGVCVVLGLLLALMFAGRFLKPIRELDDLTRRIGGAADAARVRIMTGDELERLGHSFNNMADRLKHSREELKRANNELERRVEERTLDLENANAALHEEVRVRKSMEGTLRASLKEKEVLLKEIHHRVKNNLQVVSSLLNLQMGAIKDPAYRDIFRDSQDRVKSMALIHEHLYHTRDLSRIEIGAYMRSLTASLVRSYSISASIDLSVQTDGITLGIDMAAPCGLLVNELVSNAVKHAFPNRRRGRISIELSLGQDSRFRLVVEDDGCGMPAGLDWRNTSSLGLRLVSILSEQLDGEARLLDADPGTRFEVVFFKRP